MLKRDFDDLQKRYQAGELRYNELITQVPESTRPLLRQIEAMQDTAARRAEAWAGVERALNSRLQELERERSAREELEKAASREAPKVVNQDLMRYNPIRKLSSAGSLNSIEESFFLQASLDSSDGFLSERRMSGESNVSQYFLKSMTPNAFEAALRQKDGELQSYMSRLASLESIRNSLAEDLVKMTEKYEKLKVEAAALPRLRDELDALRRRHSAALELMGERDEELEELRADIVDLKEMYREQVSLLVNKMQMLSSSV